MPKPEDHNSTDAAEIEALIARLEQGQFREGDAQLVSRLLRLLLNLLALLQQKNASLSRLKRLLFGPRSDRRRSSNDPIKTEPGGKPASATETSPSNDGPPTPPPEPAARRVGHGRMGAAAYTGAQVVRCHDPQLKSGDACPNELCRGHLYDTQAPQIFIRLSGQPLVGATCYEQQVLRCSACQERFAAPLPTGVVPEKYDATADVSVALAKYGAGLPFYRLAELQASFGVPLPAAIQFERCEEVANRVLAVFLHLRQLAADGQVVYADDTRVKILACLKEDEALAASERRATQTSGIVVAIGAQRWIALYASGRQHAGENLDELLATRRAELTAPIQMSDALAANWSGEAETIEAKCLAHARRKFIELEESFPGECGTVLAAISQVYRIEAETEGMSAEARLSHHQEQSGPVLEELREWIEAQFAERQVEPNSSLGQALRYLFKHWEGLTRFLEVAGAPLDNNVAERALKRAVLLRKNALFYKNEHGAAVGDMLLSLIETCRLNGVSAWDYLVALMRHASAARRHPEQYLPWNYPREELEVAPAA